MVQYGSVEDPNALEQIVARALTDPVFRELLFNDRDKAVEEYELTPEEARELDLLDKRTLNDNEEVALIVGATCSAFIPDSDESDDREEEVE